MTEEQAKKKWCPMVRAGLKGANTYVGINWPSGEVLDQEYAKCIGSDCMMWRWENVYTTSDGQNVMEATTDDGSGQVPNGHCGLAGKDGYRP